MKKMTIVYKNINGIANIFVIEGSFFYRLRKDIYELGF